MKNESLDTTVGTTDFDRELLAVLPLSAEYSFMFPTTDAHIG